jgi:hypothetical protein
MANSDCLTHTEFVGQDRKPNQQDRSHKSWHETKQESPVRENRPLGLTRRGLEPGLRFG